MTESKGALVDRRLEEVRRFLHTALDSPESPDAFPEEIYVPLGVNAASLFAAGRLTLLREISRSSGTVGDLARSVHRKVPSVSRDLRVLERHGLIRFRTEGKRKYPELRRHFIVIPLGAAKDNARMTHRRALPA
jgi:DNA-binding transcriptional ArsR family regulator